MKVSIITVCYNSAQTIEDTILSVINQDYPNIEYIIIDGSSADNTLSIVEKYSGKISKIISEKDEGIYFAINKGISLASGDMVGVLNSDDFYIDNKVISKVVEEALKKNVDSVYGDLQYIARTDKNKVIRYWRSKPYDRTLFLKGWMPPHPTFFVKNDLYKKFGKFNTLLRSSADYEIMLRFLYKHKISTSYIPQVLVKMREGGQSNISLKNRIKANREDKLAWKLNGLKPGWFTILAKPISKLKQFINK